LEEFIVVSKAVLFLPRPQSQVAFRTPVSHSCKSLTVLPDPSNNSVSNSSGLRLQFIHGSQRMYHHTALTSNCIPECDYTYKHIYTSAN